MKNYKSINFSKLNLVLLLILTFPIFAADYEIKIPDDIELDEEDYSFEQETRLEYGVVEAYLYKALMKMVQDNNLLARDIIKRQIFSSPIEPQLSFARFIVKLRALKLDPATLVATKINIDKFLVLSNSKLTRYNVHKVFLIALIVTHKHESELHYMNSEVAKLCEIDLKELNACEIKFLQMFRGRLMIPRSLYDEYVSAIDIFQEQLEMKKAVQPKVIKGEESKDSSSKSN
jgi:hypothetical protein